MAHILYCKFCRVPVHLNLVDGDGVWTAFCCPEHAHMWQAPLSEEEIIKDTSGHGMPYDRCQWCGCTLKSGYHEENCPVRAVANSAEFQAVRAPLSDECSGLPNVEEA